jgi:hypothetical protein
MQVADKRRNTWSVPVDGYRCIICLIGAGDMGKDHQRTCNNQHKSEQTGGNDDRCRTNFHDIILCYGFETRDDLKRVLRVQQKIRFS